MDLSQPPFDGNFEDLFQLCGIDGKMSLENFEENYKFDFSWNPNHFSSVLMWISNKGRTEYPWNSNHVTVGFEPITSAFGLSTHVSLNKENPISKRNVATSIKLFKDKKVAKMVTINIDQNQKCNKKLKNNWTNHIKSKTNTTKEKNNS